MNNWPILIEALAQSIAFVAVIYFWLWLELKLQKNIQQGLAVSDSA